MGNKSDGYLYKYFGLTSVNTAQDLKRKANPYVSAAVLVGGLAVAVLFVIMQKTVATLENTVTSRSQDASAILGGQDIEY